MFIHAFRYWAEKIWQDRENALYKSWCLLDKEKKYSSPAHETGSWYPWVVLFKTSQEHPGNFYMGVPRIC